MNKGAPMLKLLPKLAGGLVAAAIAAPAAALQTPVPAEAVTAVVDKGDTAWMMTATVLVMAMIVPGLALFYGGLVRTKNMLSVLTQIIAVASFAMIIWVIYGYSTAFGPEGNAFFSWGNLFLSQVTTDSTAATFSDEVISEYVFVSFQMTFAAITAALVLGATVSIFTVASRSMDGITTMTEQHKTEDVLAQMQSEMRLALNFPDVSGRELLDQVPEVCASTGAACHSPSNTLSATLDAIDGHLRGEGSVYLHCWGGKGRTGTVVGCWLVRHGYGSPDALDDPDGGDDVIFVLDDLRRGDLGAGHQPSPDTPDQEAFIRSWEPGM